MNTDNLSYLQEQVKYMGFGEGLNKHLETSIKQQRPEFQLATSHQFGKDIMKAVLHFKKSDQSDMYFFNKYDATLVKERGRDLSRTFYLNLGQSITFKEACNMLSGRSVEKELTRKLTDAERLQYKAELKLPPEQRGLPENWEKAPTYKAWLKLDLKNPDKNGQFPIKQFTEKYGFNLEAALNKLPLKYDDASPLGDLVRSLAKGNVLGVTLSVDGQDKKMFLEANPQFKNVTVYDENMQLAKKEAYGQLVTEDLRPDLTGQEHVSDLVEGLATQWDANQDMKPQVKPEQKQEAKKELQQSKKVDLLPKKVAKNNLLPKKHTSRGKGIGIH